MIAIIDYDAGNIKSVEKAFQYLGEDIECTRDSSVILSADKVILPGVGSFGDAMGKLKKYNLVGTIEEVCNMNKPFMGICLGLQLLFKDSDESKGVPGLGLLDGSIITIPSDNGLKVPQIGWNELELINDGRLFKGFAEEEKAFVYFVHSYYLKAKDESIVKATTDYGVKIHASVESKNIFACQFHPEKSGETGLRILKNFIEI